MKEDWYIVLALGAFIGLIAVCAVHLLGITESLFEKNLIIECLEKILYKD